MKSKFVGIVLASVLMISASGCGEQAVPQQDAVEEASVEASVEVSVEDAAAEASSEEEKEVEFTTGTVDGNVYENEYFGMKFTVPDGYEFASEDDIAKASDYVEGAMKYDRIFADAIANGTASIAAGANKSGDSEYISVLLYSDEALMDENADKYEMLSVGTEELKGFLELHGAVITEIGYDKSNICGEDHYVIRIGGTMNGKEVQEEAVCFKKDDHVMALVTASFDGEGVDDLIPCIEKN